MNNIYFIFLSIAVIIYILVSIRKGKLNIKTSFWWFIASIVMLLLSIFPYSINWFANLIGVDYPPALFLTLCVVLLVIIDFNYSKKLHDCKEKITDLAQEISILKEKINEKEK